MRYINKTIEAKLDKKEAKSKLPCDVGKKGGIGVTMIKMGHGRHFWKC